MLRFVDFVVYFVAFKRAQNTNDGKGPGHQCKCCFLFNLVRMVNPRKQKNANDNDEGKTVLTILF